MRLSPNGGSDRLGLRRLVHNLQQAGMAGLRLNLLNALLADAQERQQSGLSADRPLLDALVCVSSPLDRVAHSRQIGRWRKRVDERWLLRLLVRDTLSDPVGVQPAESQALQRVRSIPDVDAAITAPRWSHASADDDCRAASVLPRLLKQEEATLLLQACDDPWVPAAPAVQLG